MPINPRDPYDDSNIFAKILRGEIPCHKVHEDAHTLAFMDVMPQADGHTLVIPKAPSRNLLDADPAALGALRPVREGGTVTFGTQTHPADGNAGVLMARGRAS